MLKKVIKWFKDKFNVLSFFYGHLHKYELGKALIAYIIIGTFWFLGWVVITGYQFALNKLPIGLSAPLDQCLPFHVYLRVPPKNIHDGDYVQVDIQKFHFKKDGFPMKYLTKMVACSYPDVLTYEDGLDFCNGKPIAEVITNWAPYHPLAYFKPFIYNGVVPKGCYFGIGLDRLALDSRYLGFFCGKDVKYKVIPLF